MEFFPVGSTGYRGDWWFRANTDGAIVSDVPVPGNYTVTLDPTFRFGMTNFRWVNEGSIFTSLDMSTQVQITFANTPSMCRTDCTVPSCGDGILDGGEVCDDGNNVSGDRCSADCSTVVP
ncbi:MAG: hypothetical protein DRJ42_00420 [Deltaproteobacteria bacterium]|nr:MAG: hypothetical protein DRJ42_00420 [Deltaproteobacteria bacterium]